MKKPKIVVYPLAGHLLAANLKQVEREDWERWANSAPTVPLFASVSDVPQTNVPWSKTSIIAFKQGIYRETRKWWP